MNKKLLKACMVLGIAGLVSACSNQNHTSTTNTIPQFTFTSLDRQVIKSQDLSNKVVIVNFWATSCSSCIAEMPKLIEVYNKYKDKGLVMLAVSMPYDMPMYVMNFAQSRGLPFLVGMDTDSSISNSFGDITLTPTTFLFSHGKRIQKVIGEPNWAEFDATLSKELAKS